MTLSLRRMFLLARDKARVLAFVGMRMAIGLSTD
jgi:hypothetical protein